PLLNNLGFVAQHLGDYPLAASRSAEALSLARELGLKRMIAESLAALAGPQIGVDASPAAMARAARLLGAAEALREAIGFDWGAADRPVHERTAAAVRSQLDEAAFAAAWAEGRAMSSEEAIAYALEPPVRVAEPESKTMKATTGRSAELP